MAETPANSPSAGRSQVSIRIPGLLTRFTDGERSVSIRAESVDGCLARLLKAYPALEPHLLDGHEQLRPHLKVFHNGSDVTEGLGASFPLAEGDEVVVLQAVSGG